MYTYIYIYMYTHVLHTSEAIVHQSGLPSYEMEFAPPEARPKTEGEFSDALL